MAKRNLSGPVMSKNQLLDGEAWQAVHLPLSDMRPGDPPPGSRLRTPVPHWEPEMDGSYKKLATAISINAVLMFFLTFVLIDRLEHFQANINRVYMALIMAFPMVIVMLLVMPSMFKNKKLNASLYALFGALIVLVYLLMRTQTPVGNVQFLRSMIPHHSSAILMCEQAAITDPEITALCGQIVEAQEEEIAQMQAILERYR
jgi:hypothetical protein